MIINYRRPNNLVLHDQVVSPSGKYLIFIGHHFVEGKTCWDVGSSNATNGEIIRRHYNDNNNMVPEASAKTYWEELKEKILRPLEMEPEPDPLETYYQWLDIHQPGWRKHN